MRRLLSALVALMVALAISFEVVAPAYVWAQPAQKKPATGQPQDLIAKGRQLFDDQQYEDSIQTLSAALLRPNNTKEQKVEIYRLLALNYITLNRKDEADNAVRGLLVVQPDYQLPSNESPRFRDFFAAAQKKWEDEGRPGIVKEAPTQKPVVLRHGSPSSATQEKAIDIRGKLDDPENRASSVKLYYRAGSKGDFADVQAEIEGESVRAQIPAAAVKPPVMDYYFEVLDASGNVIATRGDAQSPLRVAVNDGSSSSGWVLPLAIGGSILGAAAIVGVLALAGVFKGSSTRNDPARPATVTVNVGEAALRF